MSFLIAVNGQFSPLNLNVERVSNSVSAVDSISPTSAAREFKDILNASEVETSPRTHTKIGAYQQHSKSFHQDKKREHARDIMASPVKVIHENALGIKALEMMEKFRFRHLPVVNSNNIIIGMISDRELLGPVENKICREIMVQKVIVSDELTSINEIAITFLNERINALPIINRKNEVSGIITLTDILGYVIRSTSFLSSG